MTDQKKVMSLSSLKSTLLTDESSHRWMLSVLYLPRIRQMLKENPLFGRLLTQVDMMVLVRRVLVGVFLLVLGLVFATKYLAWAAISGSLLLAIYVLSRCLRVQVAQAGTEILLKEFSVEDMSSQTLYQLCERFSRAHRCPSLVDRISTRDDLLGRAVLAAYVGSVAVFFMNFAETLAIVAIAFLLANMLLYKW